MPLAREEIEARLSTAFPDPGWPSDQAITAHTDIESVQIDTWIRSIPHWRDVSSESVILDTAPLSFMTEAALAYYLPAFVRPCWEDLDHADLLPMALVHRIERGTPGFLDLLMTSALQCLLDFLTDDLNWALYAIEEDAKRATVVVRDVLTRRSKAASALSKST